MTEEENVKAKPDETYWIYLVLPNGVQVQMSIKTAEVLSGEITRIITEARKQGYE